MTQQTTFDDIQTHSDESTTNEQKTEPETQAEFLAATEEYAAEIASEHFPNLSVEAVEWEVSTRAERQAGVTEYDCAEEDITVRLTWAAYEKFGWEKMCRTIRHELIHVWQVSEFGTGGHGAQFRRRAKELDVDTHCEMFKKPKYWLICENCEMEAPRYKRSKTVKHPGKYSCECGGDLTVEATDRA